MSDFKLLSGKTATRGAMGAGAGAIVGAILAVAGLYINSRETSTVIQQRFGKYRYVMDDDELSHVLDRWVTHVDAMRLGRSDANKALARLVEGINDALLNSGRALDALTRTAGDAPGADAAAGGAGGVGDTKRFAEAERYGKNARVLESNVAKRLTRFYRAADIALVDLPIAGKKSRREEVPADEFLRESHHSMMEVMREVSSEVWRTVQQIQSVDFD